MYTLWLYCTNWFHTIGDDAIQKWSTQYCILSFQLNLCNTPTTKNKNIGNWHEFWQQAMKVGGAKIMNLFLLICCVFVIDEYTDNSIIQCTINLYVDRCSLQLRKSLIPCSSNTCKPSHLSSFKLSASI